MRKKWLYNMHRMISWPLCRSARKFSFFSVVNMCYKVRLYLLRMRKKLLYKCTE